VHINYAPSFYNKKLGALIMSLNHDATAILAKAFGRESVGKEVLVVQHPWTDDAWVFQEKKTPVEGHAQAFKIAANGDVTDLGDVTVVSSARGASYRSLGDDFDITVSTDDARNESERSHYSTLDGMPGPFLRTLILGTPGAKPLQGTLKL
jgi:hypothetical protein